MNWHTTTTRVRYYEADPMGVVYHSNYLVYFEIGRTELLRETGMTYADLEKRGILLTVVSVTCKYRAPARYDDRIRIRTRIESVRTVRLVFAYELIRESSGELLAEGFTELACIRRNGAPQRLPADLVDRVIRHQLPPSR